MVFIGLALMAAGFFWRDRRAHLVRAAGWTLFALYWPFQAAGFFAEADPVNGWFTLLGPIFLLWIANHELKSYRWHEDPAALKWFTGASFVSAGTYFLIYEIPAITKALIFTTAQQSAWLYNVLFFGGAQRASVVQDSLGESHLYLSGGTEYAVTVVLACTAIQSIMIFVGAIACLRADQRRKMLGFLYTVPTIYFLNLFRNAGIVYGYKDLNWGMFGIESFEWMHSYVGKIGSLFAMVIIALAVFATLPELHGHILDLFELHKRRAKGFFDRKPPEKPPTAHNESDATAVIGGEA